MTGRSQFLLVVGRETSESFRRTSIRLLLVVLFVAATAAVVTPEVIAGDDTPSYDVHLDDAVAAEIADGLPALAEEQDVEITVVPDDELDDRTPRQAVEDGDLDASIEAGRPPVVLVPDEPPERLVSLLARAFSPTPPITVERLDDSDDDERLGVSSIASIVLYLALLMVTIQVANGTAIEKSSRISEVLLAVVRPGTLLFGKVVGVGLVALSGVIALVIPVLVKAALGGSLPAAALPTIGVSLLWFVMGLCLWAPLAGMFGAMVERQEEVGTAMQPITIVLVGAFFAATAAADSLLGTVLGLLPVTAPIVEPVRIARGIASPLEAVVSAVLLVVSACLAVRVGGRVYRRAIVRTGRRLRLRDVL